MGATSNRPAVALLLPDAEQAPVAAELRSGGFETCPVAGAADLAALLAVRQDIAVAVIDVESDLDTGLDAWSALHQRGRQIPALLIVSPATLDRFDGAVAGHVDDEYLTRPYSAESIRWRVEAMCIRTVAVDDGSGPVLQTNLSTGEWSPRGRLIAVFNPKGGVGKTTLATNLAAALAMRDSRVLLIDADTVTGHVTVSLGLEGAKTVVDAWRDELDGGPVESFTDLAASHPTGLRVLALASTPINTEILEPNRVARAITASQRGIDFVIVDLHPSYSPLNRAVFDRADQILLPVTPDLPAIRAALQLRDVADEMGMRDRLALVVNRANSGVATEDMERTLAMPAFGHVRSGGLTLIKAVNEGKTVVEMAPRERIAQDFMLIADRLIGAPEAQPARTPFRLFARPAVARA